MTPDPPTSAAFELVRPHESPNARTASWIHLSAAWLITVAIALPTFYFSAQRSGLFGALEDGGGSLGLIPVGISPGLQFLVAWTATSVGFLAAWYTTRSEGRALAKALLAAPFIGLTSSFSSLLPWLSHGILEGALAWLGTLVRGTVGLTLVLGGLRAIGRRFSSRIAYPPAAAFLTTLIMVVLFVTPSQTEAYGLASSLLSFVPITASTLAGFRFESDPNETNPNRWRRRIGVGLFAFGTFLLTASAGEVLFIHS
jgi:hypothetical protein